MKKAALFISIILVFSLAGCDSFFSSSWGSPREFDPNNIDVNSRNINAWINRSVCNPGLAEAVAIKVRQNLSSATGSEKAALVNGGIILAVEASGIANSMLNNALNPLKDLVDGISNEETSYEDVVDTVVDIMGGVQRDFINNNGRVNANNLAHIINSSAANDDGVLPKMKADHIENPDDLVLATIVLAISVFDMAGIDAATANFDNMNVLATQIGDDITYVGGGFNVDPNASAEVKALAACVNLITSDELKETFLTKIIKDLFSH